MSKARGPSPVTSSTNAMTPLAWAKLALGTVTIMPIRIVLVAFMFVVGDFLLTPVNHDTNSLLNRRWFSSAFVMFLATIGADLKDKEGNMLPLSPYRRMAANYVYYICRAFLFAMG